MNRSLDQPAERAAVFLALARQQRRREQGVPTLSVLVGEPEQAASAWREWAASMGWKPMILEIGVETGAGPGEAVLRVCGGVADGQRSTLARDVERVWRMLEARGPAQGGGADAFAVELADAEALLREEPLSRVRAFFTEGMVILPQDAILGSESGDASSTSQNWRPATAASFDAARAAVRAARLPTAEPEAADRARSAAERFLFDLLGDLPETAGLFELNVRLGFCFGPMPAEVDLLASRLHLAVEIDGFHHFRDPAGYRRDRRKDALLQRQGYLVLRFLAEDVVARLEDMLEEIRATVAFRRATLP